jgi:hypothetical protein
VAGSREWRCVVHTVQVRIELDEDEYREYEAEALRERTTVEALIQRVVRGLFRELKQQERDDDLPIVTP